jgi:hypothetical protein
MTALIPVGVGGLLVICGVVAFVERLLKHAMHLAAVIGLLGAVAAGIRFVPKAIKEGINLKSPATVGTGGMLLLCAVFVGFCVNSFIQARRRRRAAQQAAGQP